MEGNIKIGTENNSEIRYRLAYFWNDLFFGSYAPLRPPSIVYIRTAGV